MRATLPAIQVLDMFMNGNTLQYGCNNVADAHERTAEAWTGALLALMMPQTPMNVAQFSLQMQAFYASMKADSNGFLLYMSALASSIASSSVGQTKTSVASILGDFTGLLPPEVMAFLVMVSEQNPDLPSSSFTITSASAPPTPLIMASTPFQSTLLVCAGQIAAVDQWLSTGQYQAQDSNFPFPTTGGGWV